MDSRHDEHRMDVFYIQDIVQKLHIKNQRNKEELGYIQEKLFARIQKNEDAIIALRSEDKSKILGNLKNLREQSEFLSSELVERNNLDAYDELFFSNKIDIFCLGSRQQRKFEKLIEPSNKEIKELFKSLIDNNIFTQCQVRCPQHNAKIVNAFNLEQNVPKNQRLLCAQDSQNAAQNFQICEQKLKGYCEQEKLFAKLLKMKDFIFSLRFKVDCITNKILAQIQSSINSHQNFFLDCQKQFNDLYRLVEPIPKETYENIAEFLSKIGQLPFDDTFKTTIGKFDTILDNFEKSISATYMEFGDFLNKLVPKIIKITVEIIINNNTQVYHLEVSSNAKLLDLFNFIKEEMKSPKTEINIEQMEIAIERTQIKIDGNNLNQSPQTYVLKHEQFIEFYINQ
ncbi:unnamed protein product (macronuclear) [Paramecium tetraurelia]|uniref:Ubiquitin-like domain-containing protein n=1 Tax=Paramecium tetraurelia TaxID=5888 RepID=A0E241_PARTE|nr:uncharacterized protein GSPATT00022530001 [Paramecium tetraurelia]CAK89358.1 unnamed protein product [Paramecium tetraurelia]|eukprot:XP_001456755.1 hypothetical protein (macronuclear) [Paramecium tetraurelia strain d4-2]